MDTKWTDEQLAAIETRGSNLLVAAAAGSGKTAVLVERIIRMITQNENPIDIDRLLVVTFTNAAAAEMRERIGDAISKELEKNPNSESLQKQLALLSRASITTIHSFCLDVIKNNFHLIDLDPGFRIGDETECNLIKQDIITDLFEEKYSEEDREFQGLVEAYGGSKSDDNLSGILLKLYNFSMSGPWPERWLSEQAEEFNILSSNQLNSKKWCGILKQSIFVDLESFYGSLKQAINICEDTGGLGVYIDNLNDDMYQLDKIEHSLEGSLEDIYNALHTVKFTTLKRVKKSEVEDEGAQEDVKKIREDVKKSINKLKDEVFGVEPEEALKGIIKMYPLIKCLTNLVIEFSKRYNEKKREKGILDFNDLEHLCLKILIDNIDDEGKVKPSTVAQAFKEKFEEVLVDEYQDSNNVQETIINMVSRKNLSNPNVFMVGDVKQSIYRFRQAKPELFLDKYNTYKEVNESNNRKIMLYKNFRSRKEVIEGVNYIFKSLMSEVVGELRYDEKEALNLGAEYKDINEDTIYLEEDIENLSLAGDIEVHILDKAREEIDEGNDGEKDDYDSKNNLEDEEDLDAIQLEARIVGKKIKELMNTIEGTQYMVWDKTLNAYRKLKYKDIVILLRATKNWADTFVEELGLDGIPIYADTGTGYFQTIEVRTIISLLHIIDNPMQDIHIISVLRSPIFSFTAEELGDIKLVGANKYFYENILEIVQENHENDISEELVDKCRYFIKSLNRWREKSIYTPIDEFIWYLYTETSYYGYVGAMPNGIQRQANLRILFQRAKQYEQTSFKGLFNFINFINKLKKSSGDLGSAKILGENEDVVRIMSIHKSKGLEFPVVFLSGAGKQFNLMDVKGSLLFHEELGIGADCVDIDKRITYPTLQKYAIKKKFELETLSEEMRILYVAFTRAKEKLIITGAVSDLNKSCDKWCKATLSSKGDSISPSKVLKGKSYLDWIAMALAKHPNGCKLREVSNVNTIIDFKDLSTWKVEFWTKSQLIVEEKNLSVDKIEKELFIDDINVEINEEIKRRLDFKYKYNECCEIPSNISVSDLKRLEYEEETNDIVDILKRDIRKKPKFIQEKKGLSSAERGTIIHFIMQNIDLNSIGTIKEIEMQVNSMVEKELLTEEQAKVVKFYKIKKFFNSSLGKKLLDAFKNGRQVYRELPFITEIPVTRLNEELDKEIYKDEKLRLQGIIDCFFEDEEGIILLDYKTDYVEAGNELEIVNRYTVQMQLYASTLEKIIGKKINKIYLYLFYLDKEVEVKN